MLSLGAAIRCGAERRYTFAGHLKGHVDVRFFHLRTTPKLLSAFLYRLACSEGFTAKLSKLEAFAIGAIVSWSRGRTLVCSITATGKAFLARSRARVKAP
jgi:hypothetical protein